MVRVCHVSGMLSVFLILNTLLLTPHLLNLLLELLVFRQECTIRFITLSRVFLEREELTYNLIHCLVV